MPHDRCNAYCAEDAHCDLVYTGLRALVGRQAPDGVFEAAIREAYSAAGLRVARILAAPEAPPLAAQPPGSYRALVPGTPVDGARWLVFYEVNALA